MKNTAVLLLLLFGASAEAQNDVYADITSRIESNNVSLKELKAANQAELAGVAAENAISDTEIGFDHLWAHGSGERRWVMSVSQTFDFPGAYPARKRELAVRAEAMNMQYRIRLTDCVLNAYELMVEIARCDKGIALERAIVDDLTRVKELLERGFEQGQSTILEVNRAKIELANNIVRLNESLSRRHGCVVSLAALGVDIADETEVPYPMMVLQPVGDYIDMAENSDYVAYYNKVKQAETLGLKARRLESLPGIKIGYVHEYEDHTSFNGFSLGLTLPMFSSRARRAASAAAIDAAEWQQDADKIERQSMVETEYREASTTKELYDMLAPVFNTADHISLLTKAYKGGQMSAIEYLNEVTYFRQSEWDFLDVEYRYYRSLTRLNKYQLLLNR